MSRKPRLGQANPALSSLYSAPDVLEARRQRGGGQVEIDPSAVDYQGRLSDRLLVEVEGLKNSILQHGQRVPILVRPLGADRFQLIYGRRRLEACRELGILVRAIVTEIGDEEALKGQLVENSERQDLSFIEKALVAATLVGEDLASRERGGNRHVADILATSEQAISQMLSVVDDVGPPLISAIGPAPSIGRPRWDALRKALATTDADTETLLHVAQSTRAQSAHVDARAASDQAFLAVLAAAQAGPARISPSPRREIGTIGSAVVAIGDRGKRMTLDVRTDDAAFISWLDRNAVDLLTELHERFARSGG